MMNTDAYNRGHARHKLSCRHCLNSTSSIDYFMDCIVLKEMPGNRLKILVFGDRFYTGYADKKRVRYVDSYRVSSKKFALPHVCPDCNKNVEHDLELDPHCETCDLDFRDIWNFIENRPQDISKTYLTKKGGE